jgi:hypothetical protein
LAQPPRRDALEGVHQPGDRDLRRGGDEQVDMVVLTVQLDQLGAQVGTHAGEHLAKGAQVLAGQHPTPILGHQDQLHVEGSHDGSASTVVVILSHRPNILSGMLVRYRYRIDPTGVQRQALARAFGCARVVDNDALAERRRADLAGEKLSDSEVQRSVIALAKQTPERARLAEVASVALVQARPGRAACLPHVVRFPVGQAPRPPGRPPEVPDQAWHPVDPAHPQRLRPARDQAVGGQDQRAGGALVAHGCRVLVADTGETTDDLVRAVIEVLTSFCARLYGRRGRAIGRCVP